MIPEYNASDFPQDERVFIVKDIKEKIQELIEQLNYFDRQPANEEFSKGFEHCCKVFRKKIEKVFGKELTQKDTNKKTEGGKK